MSTRSRVVHVSCGLPANTGINFFGQDPFPVDSALNARPRLNFTIGPRINHLNDAVLVERFKNNVALVPDVATLVFTTHPSVWSAERKRLIEQELPLSVEVVNVRIVDPDRGVEASVTRYHNTYTDFTYSSSYASPLAQLDASEVKNTATLPNLQNLVISAPENQFVSQEQMDSVADSLKEIVEDSTQLVTVVLPADLSLRLEGIISALGAHRSLTSLKITPATSIDHATLTPDSALRLENALIHGLENVSQIETLSIPVEVCKPDLLAFLTRLAGLRVLRIQPSSLLSPSENGYLFRAVQRVISGLPGFGVLRTLDLHATGTPNHGSLSAVFPHTTIL